MLLGRWGAGKPDAPIGEQTAMLSMKKIVLFFLVISAIVLTGCTKKHYANFHIVAKAYYNNQPIKTDYDISIRNGHEYSKHYDQICDNGALDCQFEEYDLPEGIYEITVHGSIYITSIGKYVEDEATYSVYINEDEWIYKDFVLHLK